MIIRCTCVPRRARAQVGHYVCMVLYAVYVVLLRNRVPTLYVDPECVTFPGFTAAARERARELYAHSTLYTIHLAEVSARIVKVVTSARAILLVRSYTCLLYSIYTERTDNESLHKFHRNYYNTRDRNFQRVEGTHILHN